VAIGRSAAWFSALVLGAILLLAGSMLAPAAGVESQLRGILAPVVSTIQGGVRPVTDLVLHAGEVRELSQENAALRVEVERLQAELGAFREQRSAVETAAALIGASAYQADELLVGQVLLRDPAPGQDLLLIARGTADGVMEGQPVLGTGGTVVGVVSATEETRSWVRLITDPDSSIAVVVQSSRVPAALEGHHGNLSLEFVERGANVVVGDLLVTSTLGGQLPPGLIAGRVSATESQPQDLHLRVTVEPLADFARLEQVLVLTSFVPPLGIAASEDSP